MEKKLKEPNYFFLGILISTLVSIAIGIWLTYLIRFFDMLSSDYTYTTYITTIFGTFLVGFLLYVIYRKTFDVN